MTSIAPELVFPSARQAIREAARRAGLTRACRIAVPEWSSHCVLSAVSWCAMPVPMHEAVRHHLAVEAILIYEQWGWSFAESVYRAIQRRFGDSILLWDQVDSAHFFLSTDYGFHKPGARIVSLSKLLGYAGGGLLEVDGELQSADVRDLSPLTTVLLELSEPNQQSFECKEAFKSEAETIHPAAAALVRSQDLRTAIEAERRDRARHLEMLMEHPLSADWPAWMRENSTRGHAPGLAPLLRGRPVEHLRQASALLLRELQMQTSIYNFDWNGNPLDSAYAPCLAVPLHGQANELLKPALTLLESARA